MALLELDNVSKIYQQSRAGFIRGGKRSPKGNVIEALYNVSLAVNPGGAIGIVGESGAGKTTIARLAAGLETPSSGTVKINGDAVSRRGARQRARMVQLIWQDASGSLNPRMKVEKIIGEPLAIHGLKSGAQIRKRAAGLLEEVGLDLSLGGRYPNELSGGQAQRVAIARALALDPGLLVCDEPASALDAHVKVKLADLLVRLRRERNLALLIIAHDLTLVRRLAEELIVMRRGTLVEKGPTGEVLKLPRQPYTRLLIEAQPVLRRSASPGLASGTGDK